MSLGRTIRRVEIWVAPYSKRIYELRWVQETFERNGVFVTEEWAQVEPELDDGTTPRSRHELRQCPCCHRVVTRVQTCAECGLEFYAACIKEIDSDGRGRRLCRHCAAKTKSPVLFTIRSFLWD